MKDDNEPLRRPKDIAVGADLSMMSIEDLEERITLLASEIERIKAAIEGKKRSRDAAETFFKR